MQDKRNKDDQPGPLREKLIFGIAAFFLGGLIAAFDVPPFPQLKDGFRSTLVLFAETRQTRSEILQPNPYEGTGVVTHDPAASESGYTLIQGILPGGPQVRLIDMDGTEIHRWDIDFFALWDNPTHIVPSDNLPKSEYHYHTQGMWPLPDGSIVVNVGNYGAVRLDTCSKPIWRLDYMTHHSVTPTEDGKFWLPGHISIYDTPEELLPRGVSADQIAAALIGHLKNYNNSLVLVNADGQIEKEFSVLQAVRDAGLEHLIYASQQEIYFDPTHVNDIEVVTAALASKIDGVAVGDLLVSARDMNMIAILDQDDGHLKWYQAGPWVRQHDIDIMADGTITIFNNRETSIGNWVKGSQILSFDPATEEITILHPVSEDDRFYTSIMGAQQRLDNGNTLITESLGGRVFEATPDGDIAWEYRLPYDDETASLFEVTLRVPETYFTVTDWSCKES